MGALAADSQVRSADPCGAFRLYIASTLEESMDATARALEILANQEKLAREHVREAREALSPS